MICRMVVLLICALLGSVVVAAEGAIDADFLLQGGTIHDGAGGEPYLGDVALRADKIVGIGKFEVGKIGRTLDCRGLIVAPGFIDLHSHSDSPIVDPATRANVNYVTQGVTTVVTGNCGMGPVDVAAYFKKIDASGAGTNVIHLLPHGSLRSKVMEAVDRDPTTDELEEMKSLAEKAMADGAWGMATGLIYVPGTYSKTEELIAVAKVVAAHDGFYASHIRNEGLQLLASIEEAIAIGREAELPVHISHFKATGRGAWGTLHVAAELIEKARSEGRQVTADQYPYAASSTSLEATLLPAWSREGGRKGIEKRLADPETRTKIRKHIADDLENRVRVQIAGYDARPEWIGKSLDEIAAADGREVVDVALEMEEHGGARIINFGMNEDDVRQAMRLPWVATASDGSARIPDGDQPHPRNFGTFPRKIGLYAVREQVLPLVQAVRSCSGLPADILRIADRGYLKLGYAADVAVFNPTGIIDRAEYDNPYQYSDGVRHVFVNGRPTVFDGMPTGALAGRAIRHETTQK